MRQLDMVTMRAMVDNLGKSAAVVLHDVNFAAAHADHIIAMQAGGGACRRLDVVQPL